MSARLLRKVLKEQEQPNLVIPQNEENPNEDDSDFSQRAQNPFDLLNDDDQVQDLGQENDATETATDASTIKNEKQGHSAVTSTISAGPSSNKKSKRKKKKKSKDDHSSAQDRSKKSLDVVLEDLDLDSKAITADGREGGIQATRQKFSILKIEAKFLNAENEMRRIFGSKVVKSVQNANQSSNPRPSNSRPIRGGRRGGHNHIHRKTLLVSPSDHWQRWDGSFSMEHLETKDGSHHFQYVRSSSYIDVHKLFEAAKSTHDLNGVASILLYNPYHVESLMTMADYFKLAGEPQMAADAAAKCLYALECAWHPMFNPMQANCRLEYSHEPNKPLFSTLFTHMKNLDRRGCHRSALEVCKLLLSLDPADPMGALFCIDYYALRAEEYAWLEQFSEEYQTDKYLWHFPNFAYSLAVCRSYLEHDRSSKESDGQNIKETSFDLMKQALLLHPPVLKKLVAKVPFKDKAWTNIIENALFKFEEQGIPSVDHLIKIYVERSYLIWRLPEIQKLLKDAALSVIEIDANDGSEAKTWAWVRKEAFPSENDEYKHLLVSDFSDAVSTLPTENLQNFMIDPGMREMLQSRNQGADQQVRANAYPDPRIRDPRIRNPRIRNPRIPVPWNNAPYDLTSDVPYDLINNQSSLTELLESLLPWFQYVANEAANNRQPDGHPQDNQDHRLG